MNPIEFLNEDLDISDIALSLNTLCHIYYYEYCTPNY